MEQQNIKPASFFPFQVSAYFDYYYSGFYLIFTLLIYIFKAYYLLYPNNSIGIELSILCFFAMIQYVRLFLGTKGNKSESATTMLWFLILSVAVGFGQFFFLLLQTYVLMVEVVIGAIAVAFTGAEIIVGAIALVSFKSSEKEA